MNDRREFIAILIGATLGACIGSLSVWAWFSLLA